MNLERLNQAIAIMERAKVKNSVDMRRWQGGNINNAAVKLKEVELNECRTTACFAGHIAVSPEFQAIGGRVGELGVPLLAGDVAAPAIHKWLEISSLNNKTYVTDLIFGNLCNKEIDGDYQPSYSQFYDKPWHEVNAQDVIDKLLILRDLNY